MLMCGASIAAKDDKLMKVKADYIADKLRNPNPEIEAQIRQMRDMLLIDAKRYAEVKKRLPYIVCGNFNPPLRRTENFANTEAFILDFDHLQEKGVGITSLKNLVNRDSRVLMSFVSPSGDGLKLMFRLKEKLYDAGIFKVFYKEFAIKFATQYNLVQVVDAKTCDVTRACFMSVDKDVYYNPDAEPVDINSYINLSDPTALQDQTRAQQKSEKEQPRDPEPPHNPDPDDETLRSLKIMLGEKVRPPRAPKPNSEPKEVPEILNVLIGELKPYIENTGVTVYEIRNIQSAKKLFMQLGYKKAEINIFYGQRGFSVVAVPKRDTDGELNDLMKKLIVKFIEER